MTGDVVGGSGAGYREHAAASGPRSQSQRKVSNKTNTHKEDIKCDYQSSSINSSVSSCSKNTFMSGIPHHSSPTQNCCFK